MDWARLSTVVGIVGAVAGALLAIPGVLPSSWASLVMVLSLVAAAVGRRLVVLRNLSDGSAMVNSQALGWVLIAVSAASVVAGQADLLGEDVASGAALVAAVGLVFAKSIFGWNEPPTVPDPAREGSAVGVGDNSDSSSS